MSIKDIAKIAQVGEKSVYRYFSTKAELTIATVCLLWKEIVYELIASIDQEEYEKKDGLGQIQCLLQCFRHLYEEHSEYVLFSYDYKLFLIRHEAFLTESEYIDEIHPIQNLYLKALAKGMEDGSIAINAEPEELYYAIWGLFRGYIVKIVIYGRMYAGTNMWYKSYESACALVLGGLRAGTLNQ